ncbi:hypothetical protein MUP06_00965 [Patescibacteria group bacterium]|nr:hypothetical protein [Patescibacteria group bacterium]
MRNNLTLSKKTLVGACGLTIFGIFLCRSINAATFFEFTGGDIVTMLGYIVDFLTDLTPLMLPLIAVSVGLLVYWGIVHSVKK